MRWHPNGSTHFTKAWQPRHNHPTLRYIYFSQIAIGVMRWV
jgi:hypothetical protein